MKLALTLLSIIGLASARCPGSCSGHGACSQSDKCTCYKLWTGPACDQRKCPSTIAWSDTNGHEYAVCGNRGLCDTKSGVCNCYDGFEGKGCDRMVCPNNCGGHGTCELMSEASSGYTAWDAARIQHCVCDPGWSGPGCETRMCKPGDDSMTTQIATNPSVSQSAEVQQLQFTHGSALSGTVVLQYTNWNNEKYQTWPLDLDTITAIAIKEALVALPNQAIPSVTVSETTISATDKDFLITFIDASNSGNQVLIDVLVAGCSSAGCQPNYAGPAAATTVTQSGGSAGTTENDVCSGRGDCDGETGICACFEGYYGEMCQKQNSIE